MALSAYGRSDATSPGGLPWKSCGGLRSRLDAMLHPPPARSLRAYHQLDLGQLLQIERSTQTVIVGALVRKGWVEQVADKADQRRKLLRVTTAGNELWAKLPDLSAVINEAAFAGLGEAETEAAVRVLRLATERLQALNDKGQIA